jgi:TP901 family phage tail tape measure protein
MPDFTIKLKIDPSGAVKGAKTVERQLEKTEKRANKLQQTLKRAFAGIAAGQGALQSIRFLANFSQTMSTVKAISGATGDTFDKMRKQAIDLGTTTRFTATQAGEGMLFLARSGFEAHEIMQAIPGVLNLAQAGALSLGAAADIATNILKGFGLEVDQTARIVDVLALAANSANTTVEQMGQAMKFVAPIAAAVNMSVEEAAAAIQVLSNSGLQASMAGTGLRRVIGALEGPTTAQEKVLHSLGLTTDDVKVSQVGLSEALARIREKTNDAGIALRLFGQRGGPAALVMANAAEQMNKFAAANELAEGTGQKIAEIMDDNLNGAILRVKSAFQGLLILFGDVQAVGALRKILEGLATVLRFMARRAEGLDSALGVLTIGLIAYWFASGRALVATKALGAAMAANPMGLLIAGLTTVIALLVFFKDDLSLAGEEFITFGHIGEAVANSFNANFSAMIELMTGELPKVELGWKGVFSNIVTFGLAMVQGLAQVFDKVVGGFIGMKNAVVVIKDILVQVFDNAWIDLINGAQKFMQTAIKFWVDQINGLADKLHLPDAFKIDDVVFTEPFAKIPDEAIITGDAVGVAFMEGLKRSGLEDAFLSILTDAERLAIQQMDLTDIGEDPKIKKQDTTQDIFGPDGLAGGRKKALPTFGELAFAIKQEIELLKLNSREMEIQEGLLRMESQLKKELNAPQTRIATNLLKELQLRQEMAQAYDEINGPMENIIARQTALNVLYQEGTITLRQYQDAVDSLKISQLELNTDMESGFSRGLLKVKGNMLDLANTAESVVISAFDGMGQAIGDFVTNTETDFSGMVDGILRELTKLLVQKALLSLITGGSPIPVGGPIGPVQSNGNFARGGSFRVGGSGGTDSQPVSFNATPNERVTVETPKQQRESDQPMGSSQNITIVNVSDPDEVPNQMASSEGEKVILNVIAKNRNTVRNNLA